MADIDAEMAGASKEQTYFNSLLVHYIQAITDTLEAMDRTPIENLPKVGWDQVISRCQLLCQEATRVGLLWTGDPSEVQPLANHIAEFFSLLQELLLLAHGATVGGGRTLSTYVQTSVKQVVEVSVNLMKKAVLTYDSREERAVDVLPTAIAEVWKSWDALRMTPSNNTTAIGRGVTHVTASIKDSLREMKELKASFDSPNKDKAEASAEAESSKHENVSEVDEISPEEIRIAGYIIDVTSGALDMMNKLIRAIMGLLKKEREGGLADSVGSLEKIYELSQLIETQIKELGSCITPPQEISAIKLSLVKISNAASVIIGMVQEIEGSTLDCIDSGSDLKNLIRRVTSELPSSAAELSGGMRKLHL